MLDMTYVINGQNVLAFNIYGQKLYLLFFFSYRKAHESPYFIIFGHIIDCIYVKDSNFIIVELDL